MSFKNFEKLTLWVFHSVWARWRLVASILLKVNLRVIYSLRINRSPSRYARTRRPFVIWSASRPCTTRVVASCGVRGCHLTALRLLSIILIMPIVKVIEDA